MADNPATAFCYAITTARAFGVVAHTLLGQRAETEMLHTRAETRLTSLPFSHEEGLLLTYGVLGRRPDVQRLMDEIHERYGALLPHFFRKTQAAVLTIPCAASARRRPPRTPPRGARASRASASMLMSPCPPTAGPGSSTSVAISCARRWRSSG